MAAASASPGTSSEVAAKKKRYRLLWYHSINKVIHINTVRKNREFLNHRGLNVVPSSPYRKAVKKAPSYDLGDGDGLGGSALATDFSKLLGTSP
jgi:hypothetical protein